MPSDAARAMVVFGGTRKFFHGSFLPGGCIPYCDERAIEDSM
jgi:hypothetical protein